MTAIILEFRSSYFIYLTAITVAGVLVVIGGVIQAAEMESVFIFVLLAALAAVAQFASTSGSVAVKAGITYAVGSAIAVVAIPLYGPPAAALIMTIANITIWLVRPSNDNTWKRSWKQLGFNIGMHNLAILLAGIAFLQIQSLLEPFSILGDIAPWLVAAVVYAETNLWLLIGILRLQLGEKISIWEVWREDRWATLIDIALISIGGGVLYYAATNFDWLGVLIFFLPILLSSFSFQLYVGQMRAHMDNLEMIVQERTQELAELNKEKDAFLAVLTHDMKTPLTTIGMYAEMISKHPELLQKRPRVKNAILRSQQMLLDIVNNILDLEKLQTGGSLLIDKTHLDLNDLVEYSTGLVSLLANDKEIDLTTNLADQSLIINGDPKQLSRALLNLISNAIKYTPNGGKICIGTYKNGSMVHVHIDDTGYGIPADELPYIFDRYSRVSKHVNKAIGTGLGLAITKAIIEAHGGEISVVSQEGVGSKFVLMLPYVK